MKTLGLKSIGKHLADNSSQVCADDDDDDDDNNDGRGRERERESMHSDDLCNGYLA